MFRTFLITVLINLVIASTGINISYAYFFIEKQEDQVEKKEAEAEENTNKKPQTPKSLQRSEIEIIAPIDAFQQNNEDLKHYLSQDKVKSLLVGTDEYVIVETSSFTQNNKGVAILLPDWQQGLTNPKAINYLRKEMPHVGWSTLSIQPPNAPSNYPSNAASKEEQIKENEEIIKNYQEKLALLMTAVMEKAQNYPGIFLVITQGSQAAMLTQLYKNNTTLSPTALIILSAGMRTTEESEMFAMNLATSDLPTLDLILKRDNKNLTDNAILRKKLATKEMKVLYRQRELHNIHAGYYPEKTLLVEINGWLKTIGW